MFISEMRLLNDIGNKKVENWRLMVPICNKLVIDPNANEES